MGRFGDKVVVVTGGSRGMGRAMVRAFAAEGASVVIASRKIDACEELAAEVSAQHGVPTLPVACNVSSWDDCDALVAAVDEAFGRADVLVNNAGLSPLYPALGEVSEGLFDKVLGVNLKGPFRLAAALGTRMVAAGGGAIVNISSIAAIRPGPAELPYAMAKAGLNTLTEGLAQAFGPTVRVNAVQAGPFRTDISTAWTPEVVGAFERSTALRRIGEPEEVVPAVLHLASDEASFTTGAVLRVDGGMP
ncbi:NAD(P)-dependent dehydrogenase (short-subunit alcohol dehydrogenase family) [Actinomycetospora succinea]|uniref:NAD(P)-dependent dehydrogenase (Short-subunit alcohol dehydrogenase family) n=1 Tax=Actinomycetospora succinea TaxID=663603 RepID=A0A4R6VKP2_9PSEU|nr:SDR family oxidoreductase [Actinomycetospora succinea]TDQ62381.1 NAD(P)-dependent dehydrogenase (short-subunit alcohol dehydrogenase family) [Actinomycetospora succinea]